MHTLTQFLGWLFAGVSLAGSLYMFLAASVASRFMSVRTLTANEQPSVTLLKPLHFDSPGLEEDLATFLAQDYVAPVQIVFGVQNANDPAITIVNHIPESTSNLSSIPAPMGTTPRFPT